MNYMDHSCLFSDHQKTLSQEIQKFVYIVPTYPLTFENRFAPPTPKKKSIAFNLKNKMTLSKKKSRIFIGCLLFISCVQLVLSSWAMESLSTSEHEGSKLSKRRVQDPIVHSKKLAAWSIIEL